MLTLCRHCTKLFRPCLVKSQSLSHQSPSVQILGFHKTPSQQEKKGVGKKEVNAENKCHMSERVNLIWSEVKFDAIYSESCVCSISVLPCHIGYLRLSVPCASPCSLSLPMKHTHTHALCKCWKITRRSFKRLWVCFLLKKRRVWLQRQPKNFFWCTETRGVIFIMYISDRKSSRTITLNLFLHLIRWCFCFLLLLLCIRHFGLSRNSLAKKLRAVSAEHAWESSGLLQVECGFVPEVLTIKL